MKRYTIIIILIGVCLVMFFNRKHGGIGYSRSYSNERTLTGSADSYSFKNRTGGWEGNEVNLNCEFSGLNTLGDIEVEKEQDVELTYNINVKSGRFKVILTSATSILTEIEGSASGQQKVTLPRGKYAIKIVGDSAAATLSLAIKGGEGLTLTPRSTSIFDDDWM